MLYIITNRERLYDYDYDHDWERNDSIAIIAVFLSVHIIEQIFNYNILVFKL